MTLLFPIKIGVSNLKCNEFNFNLTIYETDRTTDSITIGDGFFLGNMTCFQSNFTQDIFSVHTISPALQYRIH